jgi:hypothetical protein
MKVEMSKVEKLEIDDHRHFRAIHVIIIPILHAKIELGTGLEHNT